MQRGEETKQVLKMEVKKKSTSSAVLVQAVCFLTLGRMELLEFCWLGIADQEQLIKAVWFELFHIKLSRFWVVSQSNLLVRLATVTLHRNFSSSFCPEDQSHCVCNLIKHQQSNPKPKWNPPSSSALN